LSNRKFTRPLSPGQSLSVTRSIPTPLDRPQNCVIGPGSGASKP